MALKLGSSCLLLSYIIVYNVPGSLHTTPPTQNAQRACPRLLLNCSIIYRLLNLCTYFLCDFWCYQYRLQCILFLNSQNGMYQSPPSRQQSINNGSTQPQQLKTQQQQQPPHPNNTPSPRIQHSGVPPNQQLVSCTSHILLVVTLG